MGTRSFIAKPIEGGKYKAVYCHWDGHPKHHLPILRNHYKDPVKVDTLIDNGAMSTLGKEIGEKHDFDKAYEEHPDWCLFYSRDRGEEKVKAEVFESKDAMLNHFNGDVCMEHLYVFNGKGGWKHYKSHYFR